MFACLRLRELGSRCRNSEDNILKQTSVHTPNFCQSFRMIRGMSCNESSCLDSPCEDGKAPLNRLIRRMFDVMEDILKIADLHVIRLIADCFVILDHRVCQRLVNDSTDAIYSNKCCRSSIELSVRIGNIIEGGREEGVHAVRRRLRRHGTSARILQLCQCLSEIDSSTCTTFP